MYSMTTQEKQLEYFKWKFANMTEEEQEDYQDDPSHDPDKDCWA